MGYYTHCDGSLDIYPPIKEDLVDSQFLQERRGWFWFAPDHDGLIRHIEIYDDQSKAYYIDEEIREIVAEVKSHGSAVNGYVEGFGEDSTDIWRFLIKDNDITREQAEIRWPDGTKVESRY